jgi:hypothetical protein
MGDEEYIPDPDRYKPDYDKWADPFRIYGRCVPLAIVPVASLGSE